MPRKSVLKEIKPGGSFVDHAAKLVFGDTADDPIAELVRESRYLAKWRETLTARRAKIGEARIQAVESQVLAGQKTFTDTEAMTVWGLSRWLNRQWNGHRARLQRATEAAMASGNADWFFAVAKAIETDKDHNGQRLYLLHEALLRLAVERNTHPASSKVLRELLHLRYATTGKRCVKGYPVDGELPWTIDELPGVLKRLTGRQYDPAQIWRACAVLKLKPKGNPNPKSSRRKSKVFRTIQNELPKRHIPDGETRALMLLEEINPQLAAKAYTFTKKTR